MTHLEKVCFVEECAGSVIMPVMKIEMNDWTPATGPLENCGLFLKIVASSSGAQEELEAEMPRHERFDEKLTSRICSKTQIRQ